MSAILTEKEFSKHLNTKFRVSTEPPIELVLDEVKGYVGRENEAKGMERFSLFFSGPGDRFLPQQVYSLDHDEMGAFDLFLVPIGQSESEYRYEAVFNYFREQ